MGPTIYIEVTILHTTISSSPCLSLVSLVLLTQGAGTGFITVCYILSWVGLFQQFAGPPRLMESVRAGTCKGKAESGSWLLDWPGSMDRKAKSSRRWGQVVEPGLNWKRLDHFLIGKTEGCTRPESQEYFTRPRSNVCQIRGQGKQQWKWVEWKDLELPQILTSVWPLLS